MGLSILHRTVCPGPPGAEPRLYPHQGDVWFSGGGTGVLWDHKILSTGITPRVRMLCSESGVAVVSTLCWLGLTWISLGEHMKLDRSPAGGTIALDNSLHGVHGCSQQMLWDLWTTDRQAGGCRTSVARAGHRQTDGRRRAKHRLQYTAKTRTGHMAV